MILITHKLDDTLRVIDNIHNARQQWEDGLINTSEMMRKVDDIMINYLGLKGIVEPITLMTHKWAQLSEAQKKTFLEKLGV